MGTKDHAVWIVGATFVGLAVEGWQTMAGQVVAHAIGVPHAFTAVIGASVIGWCFSCLYEKPRHELEKPKAKPAAPKAASKPKVRKHK
jgi:hypothetical protein